RGTESLPHEAALAELAQQDLRRWRPAGHRHVVVKPEEADLDNLRHRARSSGQAPEEGLYVDHHSFGLSIRLGHGRREIHEAGKVDLAAELFPDFSGERLMIRLPLLGFAP